MVISSIRNVDEESTALHGHREPGLGESLAPGDFFSHGNVWKIASELLAEVVVG